MEGSVSGLARKEKERFNRVLDEHDPIRKARPDNPWAYRSFDDLAADVQRNCEMLGYDATDADVLIDEIAAEILS